MNVIKLDPYINVDSGRMSPVEHGECFVTLDGAQTDMSVGVYHRFLDQNMSADNCITSGKIFKSVIQKERRGDYLGKTVQVIPHITDEIKRRIKAVAKGKDFVVVQIGGTVGDIESLPFVEAQRQMMCEEEGKCLSIHYTYVPYLRAAGELKTKPTQHSVHELLSEGVQPDMLVLRSEHSLERDMKDKVALFCNIKKENVFESIDVKYPYELAINMNKAGIVPRIFKLFGMDVPNKEIRLEGFSNLVEALNSTRPALRIALVGKYTDRPDAYRSIIESLTLASSAANRRLELTLIKAETVDDAISEDMFGRVDGIIIAPGFGERGYEGKIAASRYALRKNVPLLGIGLGMQCATIAFAREKMGMVRAGSMEMNDINIDQLFVAGNVGEEKIRLGAFEFKIIPDTIASKIYKSDLAIGRHRNRFELNKEYIARMEAAGMKVSAISYEGEYAEMVECKLCDFYVGMIFHPEYDTTLERVHPIFSEFINATLKTKKK